MTPDPTNLDNLQDIVTPPPVSWWPLATGWWVLFATLLVGAVIIAFRVWQSWRGNAYRRAALRELRTAKTVPDIADILKRTALAANPRAEVASLTGITWSQWLVQTLGEPVPDQIGEALGRGVFAEADNIDVSQVVKFAENWIRCHRRSTSHSIGSPHE